MLWGTSRGYRPPDRGEIQTASVLRFAVALAGLGLEQAGDGVMVLTGVFRNLSKWVVDPTSPFGGDWLGVPQLGSTLGSVELRAAGGRGPRLHPGLSWRAIIPRILWKEAQTIDASWNFITNDDIHRRSGSAN